MLLKHIRSCSLNTVLYHVNSGVDELQTTFHVHFSSLVRAQKQKQIFELVPRTGFSKRTKTLVQTNLEADLQRTNW